MSGSFGRWLVKLQTERPYLVIVVMLLTLVPAGYAASKLTLRTSFTELLPDSKPSVVEMRRVNERLTGNSTLALVAKAGETATLKRFVDYVVPKIRELGPEVVGSVDDGPRGMHAFFEHNKHLYADLKDLQELRDEVVSSYDAQVAKATGMDLGLDDEEAKPISADDIVSKLEKKAEKAKAASPGRDGYYISKDGKTAVVLIRVRLGTADQRAFALRDRVQIIADGFDPKKDWSFKTGFTGNLVISAEQQRAITGDLTEVGAWGVCFILAVVYLFFLQLRVLLAMGLTIGIGGVWSFALAYYTVGYLNSATGFLTSIIAGNGINFGIIFMARYAEARRDEKLPVPEATNVAFFNTWRPTLAAAGAGGIAYGSLSITDFRGFKHFGIIGGLGMLLCWAATFLLLPAVLVVTERFSPMFQAKNRMDDLRVRFSGMYGRPLAWLTGRFPAPIAFAGVLLGLVSVVLGVRYLAGDPMEYDFRNVRNEDTGPTPARLLGKEVDDIVGRQGQDGRAILVNRLDQVPPLIVELNRRRDAATPDEKPFSKVVSVFDLLPDHQKEKLALLTEIKDKVTRARKRHFIGDADWARLAPHLPEALTELRVEDLPEQLVLPFSERDGTRGRVVYIVPTEKKSVYDAHYLERWAAAFREVKLPNGEIIRGSGDPVIFTDMMTAIREESPKAITLSFLGTVAVILFTFRGRKTGFIALSTLMLGISWLLAFLVLKGVKINFLNFVALPISIGVGADYAVNVMTRLENDAGSTVERVIIETGGAVILCSLTTCLGYFALLLSINRAVASFGLLAATGELAALGAAVLVLPAVLIWVRRRRERGSAARTP